MNIKEFECIECGHTFDHDIDAKDVWEERVCEYGEVSESNYISYAEDITDAFNITYQNRPVLKNGKRSKAKVSHFYPRDGVMLVKIGKFVTAVVKEIEY